MINIKSAILIFLLVLFIVAVNPVFAHAETYEYDALNRLTKIIYDDGSVVTYSYDKNGNILDTDLDLKNNGQATNAPEPTSTVTPLLPMPTETAPSLYIPGVGPTELPISTQSPIITGRGSLRISVFAYASESAVEGVVVEIYYLGDYGVRQTTTNENGLIELSDLKTGSYQLVIVSVPSGYKVPANHTITLSVQTGRTSETVFRLTESASGTNAKDHIGNDMENNKQGDNSSVELEGGKHTGSNKDSSKNTDNKPPKVNLKAKKKYKRSKKVIVKDHSGIKTIKLNKKKIKFRKGAKKVKFRLKKYSVKKGWCKLVATDVYGNKTKVKFRMG